MADEHVQVLDRAFDILETLAHANAPMALGELAHAIQMSKSTVHRLLHTLCERGYAEKTLEGGYAVGPKLFEVVSYHINSLELQTEAKPVLSDLKVEVGLTSHLGILDGPYVSYIDKETLNLGGEAYTRIGYRSPAYCSSMGKCLLACLSSDQLDEVLYGCRFERFTPRTITQRSAFVECLREARRQGWAIDDEEYEPGHRCIAAPVYDYRGDAIAAIGVSGTTVTIPEDRIDDVARSVMAAAQRVSRSMGYFE